jgi:hypothetical protein
LIALTGSEALQSFTVILGFCYAFQDVIVADARMMVNRQPDTGRVHRKHQLEFLAGAIVIALERGAADTVRRNDRRPRFAELAVEGRRRESEGCAP